MRVDTNRLTMCPFSSLYVSSRGVEGSVPPVAQPPPPPASSQPLAHPVEPKPSETPTLEVAESSGVSGEHVGVKEVEVEVEGDGEGQKVGVSLGKEELAVPGGKEGSESVDGEVAVVRGG